MGVPEAVRAWFSKLDTADEAPEELGAGENPAAEPDADELGNPELEAAESGADTPTEGGAAGASEGQEPTVPEPPSGLTDADRDVANTLAAENEALREENRTLRERIAELGGDAALGIVEEEADPADSITGDVEPEYNPDEDMEAEAAEVERIRNMV